MSNPNRLNGGQVIIDYLIREKVPYVFGLCGHGNIGLIDAMYERSDEIRTISVHHESISGFMADVYNAFPANQRRPSPHADRVSGTACRTAVY